MPTRYGTIKDYLHDVDAQIQERGLVPARLEDIAPICITLWADLAWAKQAEAAVRRLAKDKHPILSIGPAGIPARISFRDLEDQGDRTGLALLYKQAFLDEVSRHLDSASWHVQADQFGALEIERDGEVVFSGDAWGEFAWYASSEMVKERCADVEDALAPGCP